MEGGDSGGASLRRRAGLLRREREWFAPRAGSLLRHIIVIAANRLMESFGFTRSGFVTSCSAVTFSLEQDTLPADLISSDQPLYHDQPVLAIIISFIVASHHHGQTSISHRVSPTLKSSTLSTPISSQPYVDYNLSLFQAAAASCPREIQLTLCTK